jgi:hypothetical protein
MRIKKVIDAKKWVNKKTGQTASIYGAVPYSNDEHDWEIKHCGFTWEMDDGTIGFGRQPVKTELEANEIMRKINTQDDEDRKIWEQVFKNKGVKNEK